LNIFIGMMIKILPKQAPEYNVLALHRHYLYLAGLSKQNQQNGRTLF